MAHAKTSQYQTPQGFGEARSTKRDGPEIKAEIEQIKLFIKMEKSYS